MANKLYLDMDGTLVDFVSQVNKYGYWRKNKSNKVDWDKVIAEGPKFWAKMDWMPGAKEAFETLEYYASEGFFELYILSSIDFDEGREGKELWINSHTNFPLENVIFVLEPEYKDRYANKNAWLIDDREKSINPFFDAGGNTILFIGDWNKALNDLKKVKYELIYRNKNILKYKYYSYGIFSTASGIIDVKLDELAFELRKLAPDDYYDYVVKEDDKIPYPKRGYYAIRDIAKFMNEDKKIPKWGIPNFCPN